MNFWQEDYRKSLTTKKELETFFESEFPDLNYSIRIPVSFAQKIKNKGPQSVLWKQFLPNLTESESTGYIDPIGDMNHKKVSGIIHRYNNRVLITPTNRCPVICRYCFRKNELDEAGVIDFKKEETLQYLKSEKQINEVILTGGDPLVLSDAKLLELAKDISHISHIKFFRIHTRFPTIISSRLDQSFLNTCIEIKSLFKRFQLVIHVNHCEELDQSLCQKLKNFHKHGIEIMSQTVLLKDINNNIHDLINLFTLLSEVGVTPYYLHHPDQVKGSKHFYIPLIEGRKLYSKLRDQLSGWMLPEYVIDIPGGEGKIPAFNPEKLEFSGQVINRFGEFSTILETHY